MDWAEELKMSIRKTTARKGRRAKSRDVLKDSSSTSATTSGTTATAAADNNVNKDITVDITLDLQQSSSSAVGTSSAITGSPPSTSGTVDSDGRRPPRRISGGWADTGGLKNSKSKNKSFEDERFQFSSPKSVTSTTPDDEIPVIPDLDDVKDEILMNEIVEPPSVSVNRVVTLKELNSDLLSQNAFSAIEDVDLTILTRCLQAQDSLDEADEVWEWDKLFTDVIAEIHAEKTKPSSSAATIGAEEIMPATMYA